MTELGTVKSVFTGHNAVIVTCMYVHELKVVKLHEAFWGRFTWKEKSGIILRVVASPPVFSVRSIW